MEVSQVAREARATSEEKKPVCDKSGRDRASLARV